MIAFKGHRISSAICTRSIQLVNCQRRRNLCRQPRELCQPIKGLKPKFVTAKEALSCLKSGDYIFMGTTTSAPKALSHAMLDVALANNITDVKVFHLLSLSIPDYMRTEYSKIFRVQAAFVSSLDREAVNSGRADFIPIFLHDIPLLFERGIIKPTISMIQVTPADDHGYHSLGNSVTCIREATSISDIIIGEVNPRVPRTYGDTMIHESHFDFLVENNSELDATSPKKLTDIEQTIGKYIANNLIEDGTTLQIGIGGIPEAVLAQLKNHKDLGIHTEMLSDGVIDLIDNGNITNRLKTTDRGLLCATFLMGSNRFYNYFDDNPYLVMRTCRYTNDPFIFASNPKATAINSCLEIDLCGQVASDTIGTKIFSGYGGQVDFLRGAALSNDGKGKPILALPSTTNKGESKIVSFLKHGAGVTTSRAHVHYVVTEYGIASLFGRNIRQRAAELISIAHPDHRETLEKAAFERLKCMPSKD